MTSPAGTERFEFAFAASYRLPALVFGVAARSAWVEVSPAELLVRFGPWRLRTPRSNITGVQISTGYAFLKAAGPARLSFSDRGVTFATNGERGVCVRFREPVAALDPTGHLRHPGATLTVARPDELAALLGSGSPDARSEATS